MAGLNSRMWVDTAFINKLEHLPEDVEKAAHRAVRKTSAWLRVVTMAELGYELKIDNKSAFRSRFKVFKHAGVRARLWVGIRNIGVHRLGAPKQQKGGVKVGEHFFDDAFISPMNSDELLVWRRTGVIKKKKDGTKSAAIELVEMDIAEEAEEILGTYQLELNAKFQEYFIREFNALYRS